MKVDENPKVYLKESGVSLITTRANAVKLKRNQRHKLGPCVADFLCC